MVSLISGPSHNTIHTQNHQPLIDLQIPHIDSHRLNAPFFHRVTAPETSIFWAENLITHL